MVRAEGDVDYTCRIDFQPDGINRDFLHFQSLDIPPLFFLFFHVPGNCREGLDIELDRHPPTGDHF